MKALLLRACVAAAAFGYALGAAHSERYALRNLVKLPLLIVGTALVCAPSYWVAARMLGARLGFATTQRVALLLFHDAAVLLASLAPVVWFLGRVLRATDDGWLGGYDTFLAATMGAVAGCGALALVRQARVLLRQHHCGRRTARAVVMAWLALALVVGGQAAFWLRPLFGLPASRGANPPWFLGATPDLRGATSFYEMVWQTIARPELRLGGR